MPRVTTTLEQVNFIVVALIADINIYYNMVSLSIGQFIRGVGSIESKKMKQNYYNTTIRIYIY